MRFRAASEQAVLVYLGDEIGLTSHARVLRLLRALQIEPLPWLRNLQPAYCSLLVGFDPCQIDHPQVESAVRQAAREAKDVPSPTPRRVEIPVCYGGEFGPDLEQVAALRGLKPERVVELHTSVLYRSYFLGFAPGFAYLGDLSSELATARLPTPRKKVTAGSVAIADRQTGVYPFASPGGWRLLGRTPLSMFRADRDPMGLISFGDEVRFFPITIAEFAKWEKS